MKEKLQYLVGGILALVIAVTFSSCGSSQEKLVKQQIDAMNEYADEFDKDPKSEKLAKIDKKLEEIAERAKDMDELSETLVEKYKSTLETAMGRYMKAKLCLDGGRPRRHAQRHRDARHS